MALSPCNTTTDDSGRELVQHGTGPFPVACYHDALGIGHVPWHWHQELEAAIVSEGTCLVMAGGEKHIISAGEGFFINSQVLHGCWDVDASGCRLHSLVFHPRLVGGANDSIYYQNYLSPLMSHPALEMLHLSPAVPWQKAALYSIEEAWLQGTQEPEGYEFSLRHQLSQLIYLIFQNLPKGLVQRQNERDGSRIKAMLTHIHENFGEELTVRSIAGAAMVSESECLRCFRNTIGTTPIRYVKQYRIRQASQMLLSTDEKISEIAHRCGFQDISYFTKSFREINGCSPTDYRALGNGRN